MATEQEIKAILDKPTREWTREERNILNAAIKQYGRAKLKDMRNE